MSTSQANQGKTSARKAATSRTVQGRVISTGSDRLQIGGRTARPEAPWLRIAAELLGNVFGRGGLIDSWRDVRKVEIEVDADIHKAEIAADVEVRKAEIAANAEVRKAEIEANAEVRKAEIEAETRREAMRLGVKLTDAKTA
ncbi:hypothetical protein [Streptomyces sp. Y1]|uniref:Uncharacterized protein n=1 Tax=Streptomyces sp. Y1 TaxID=3238634 RepID=A0AB39TU69_9ACTN